ncbi:MAG: glycosyltransferase family 39 protein [Clostridia bacterium]
MKKKSIILFNVVFVIVFVYIVCNSIFFNDVTFFRYEPLPVILGVFSYILIFCLIGYYLKGKVKINTKVIVTIVFIVIILVQIMSAYLYRVEPGWDVKDLFDNAGKYIHGSAFDLKYLYNYSNNLAMQMIIIFIFIIAELFKISAYSLSMGFNIILIDIAIFFMYLCAKKLYGKKNAIISLFFIALMTPIYLYVPIIYTDSFSMLFPILILYIYLIACEKTKKIDRNILYVFLAIVSFIGIKIKATVAIIVIAMFIVHLIYNKTKTIIPLMISFITVFILFTIIFNYLIYGIFKDWNKDSFEKNSFPITHWIMMGMTGNGSYKSSDFNNTKMMPTYQAKKNMINKTIKYRFNLIKNGNINEFIKGKLVYTWGEGTYFAQTMLSIKPTNLGIQHEYISENGSKNDIYKYYSQIQHISMLLLMIISVLSFNKSKEKENYKYSNILTITIFGVFLFFLFWETRSRYIANYIPVMVLIATKGIDNIAEFFTSNLVPKAKKILKNK